MPSPDDDLPLGCAVLIILVFLAAMGFYAWAHFSAKCSQIDWMPVKEIPSRCLVVKTR